LIIVFAMVVAIGGCGSVVREEVWADSAVGVQEAADGASRPEPVEFADAGGVLTLREAIARALMGNPELLAYSWEIRAAEARQLQAGLWPNPELEVEVEDVGGSGDLRGFDGAETTIALSQVVELGDRSGKRAKVAGFEKELAGWDYEAKRLEVLGRVSRRFVEVLGAQERVLLAEESLSLAETMVETVGKRVAAGRDTVVEQTKAEVALARVRIEHEQARESLEAARRSLAATWGASDARFESAAGELQTVRPVPTREEFAGMLERTPDVLRWSTEIERRKAAIELEQSRAYSDVTVLGGVKRYEESDDEALVFGVAVPLPISDRNQGGKQEAAHNLARAREQQKAARIAVEEELNAAYSELHNGYIAAVQLRESVLAGAREVFDASRLGYSEGKLDYLEVLDAQRTLFEARSDYVAALVSYHTAKARVERLVARPIESIGVREL
jgi:cobalt-zinc-cadmium efflux system outer membrane protein